MASFKNQHFVPRCHLKSFASDADRKSICVFNIRRSTLINNAPIKSQCSADYFYGDAAEESRFHQFESWYAEALRDVISGNLSESAGEKLRTFAIVQYARTQGAAKLLTEYSAKFRSMIDPEGREFSEKEVWTEKVALKESLATVAQHHRFFNDLRWTIIVNKSRIKFVTSDDPVLFTNRYAWQKLRVRKFGVISSGLTVSMPLTPHHWIIFYDNLVYKMRDEVARTVIITKDEDANTLNELQCIKSLDNIYCESNLSELDIRRGLNAVARNRSEERFELIQYKQSLTSEKHYDQVENPDIYDGSKYLTRLAPVYPVPPKWFPKLQIRIRPRFFTKGTIIRHVRNPDWLSEEGMNRWRYRGA